LTKSQSRFYIDIISGCPCRLGDRSAGDRELWQGRVSGVEGESTCKMNWDVNVEGSIEIWVKPGGPIGSMGLSWGS